MAKTQTSFHSEIIMTTCVKKPSSPAEARSDCVWSMEPVELTGRTYNAPVACGSIEILQHRLIPVMLNKAKTSRPRPKLRGRGQFLEVEAKAEAKK